MTRRDPLPLALQLLTFVTGLVDAVSFLALDHVFTANMTGNVVLLAFAVAGAPGLSVARSLTALVVFLVGAVLGGRLGVVMAATRRRWLVTVGVSEAVLLFAAAVVATGLAVGSGTPGRIYAVIVLTALAMGLRNATVRRVAVPDLTTTVLTLTLTAVAAESSLAGGGNPRIGRRIGSVAAMFAGAAIGALLLRLGPAVPLAVGGACVFAAVAAYAVVPASTPSTGPS
jgi:uncharacterized membrane protein YoaK (UPF0700 family)